MEYTKYAAVGHFKCHRTLDGKKYPVVIVGQKEYMLDVQEMTVWSSLAWRILSRSQIAEAYLKLTRGLSFTSRRTLDDCIDRLVTRGLVAEGRGGSEYESLYDLLSCLYIAPVSANPFLRLGAFLKLWIWDVHRSLKQFACSPVRSIAQRNGRSCGWRIGRFSAVRN